jgi:type I restriction enzyme, S subunit
LCRPKAGPFVLPAIRWRQHRIVAKVAELMALCDQLEASLDNGDDTRRRLLDALLAEALVPREMQEQAA